MAGNNEIDYSIGEVSKRTGVPQSTLRYWETVFPQLQPHKTEGGSRRYSEDMIVLVQHINDLLHNKGFTIKGAERMLSEKEELKESEATRPKADDNLPLFAKEKKEMPAQSEPQKALQSAPGQESSDFLKNLRRELYQIRKILEE